VNARRSAPLLGHVRPVPASTLACSGPELLIALAAAVGGADLVVPRLFPLSVLRLIAPVMLGVAVFLLFTAGARVRQLQQRTLAAATRVTPVAQAVAGPCDGQHLLLPAGRLVPAEVWLATQEAAADEPLTCYLIERPVTNHPSYRHAPGADQRRPRPD